MNLGWNKKAMLLTGLVVLAAGCQPKMSKIPRASAAAVAPATPDGAVVSLTIMGFNYTDYDINEFFVDGTGGGNLYVSSASGGGGGSVCCASYVIGSPAPMVKVRWQADACIYDIRRYNDGKEFSDIFSIYKQASVQVAAIASTPKYLEIHIYPDGHVEAAITDEVSRPRRVLDQNRRVNTPFRQCPNGVKPVDKSV